MSDLISRQAAINAPVRMVSEGIEWIPVYHIENLPSAQPKRTEERTKTHACDLIDRQAALEAMDTWDKFGCDPDGRLVRYDDDKHYVPYVHYDDMVHAIKHLPSAQPENRRGHWVKSEYFGGRGRLYRCDQCGNYLDFRGVNAGRGDANFCPNCGADMRGEQDE